MKQLIICSASDAHHLQTIVRRITVETTLLLSAGNADERVLRGLETDAVTLNYGYNCDNAESRTKLRQEMEELERAYFVVSNPVMSSSALQALCYSLYPRLLNADCWKITLEPAKIPLGFAFLRNLPEGLPFELTLAESLLRRVQAAFTA